MHLQGSYEIMGVRRTAMQRFAWVWYAGCAAWLVDGGVSLTLHAWQHAQLAFIVALVFLMAGVFYQKQDR